MKLSGNTTAVAARWDGPRWDTRYWGWLLVSKNWCCYQLLDWYWVAGKGRSRSWCQTKKLTPERHAW